MTQKEYNPKFYTNEELKNKSGIYQIRNLVNNKIYIGSSTNLPKRKNTHFSLLKNNKHHSKETRIKMSQNRKPITEEQRKILSKLASKKIGEKNPFYGKKHTEKTKQKMREHKSKPVVKIYPNYEYYNSFLEAGYKNNISKTSVYNSCKFETFTKGMKFMKYKDWIDLHKE